MSKAALARVANPSPAAPDPLETATSRIVEQGPRCAKTAKYCVGVALHLALHEGKVAHELSWINEQFAAMRSRFATIDVDFEVVSAEVHPEEAWHIASRAQRDQLGARKLAPGVVHVFLVGRLDDVDVADTQIRGVHWRQRKNIARRWIILSRIAESVVLTHEMGHFFSLPHSRYRASLMNKRPRKQPRWSDRVFVPAEVERMRSARDRMLKAGTLVLRK